MTDQPNEPRTAAQEHDRPIWGLSNIAKVLGVSVDTARRWSRKPGAPIHQPARSGQYFALKGELLA